MNIYFITTLLYLYSKDIENGVYGAKAAWTALATSNLYANKRMATEDDTYFEPRYISKTMPQIWAKMGCAESCVADQNCRAFSFYETGEFYVCDLASTNYCSDQTVKVLINQPGSFVWDTMSNGSTLTCFQAKIANVNVVPIPCELIRPGCLGNWPNCTNCLRTCRECYLRFFAERRTCTLWPDGDDESTSIPLVTKCYLDYHVMMRRKLNVTTGEVLLDYRMPFEDINRIEKLYLYNCIRFVFKDHFGGYYFSFYKTSYIESNGTLRNVTLLAGQDVLNTSIYPPKQVPFITVTNDTYGCGSFWLADLSNATYCPGGISRMFGTPIVNGTRLISTGIRYNDYLPASIFIEGEINRYPFC